MTPGVVALVMVVVALAVAVAPLVAVVAALVAVVAAGVVVDDRDGRAAADLTLLVVPVAAITRPPIPGFPVTLGAVEYQLVGLVQDAHPGRLLNVVL